MDRVFTAIERAALPKQVVYSDFVAAPAKISDCEVSDRRLSFPKIMSGRNGGAILIEHCERNSASPTKTRRCYVQPSEVYAGEMSV
jgi:hypothetical protein